MDFHDEISCQRFELEGWDLVHCLLISFCFGSEILKKIRPPEPPKKTQKPQKKTYGFSRWDNLPTLWVRRLGFGTVFTNIILPWIQKFSEIRTTLTPLNPPPTMWDLSVWWGLLAHKMCTNNLICIMSFWFSLIVFQLISFLLNLIFINMFKKIEFGLICSVFFYLTFLINVYIRL